MKTNKTLLTLVSATLLTLCVANTSADFNSDVDTVLNWGEVNYPQFLPGHESTQTYDVWRYRYFQPSNLYVGVNSKDAGVYLLSGVPGSPIIFYTKLDSLLGAINSANFQGCDPLRAPLGFSYIPTSNAIKVTTLGSCYVASKAPLCSPHGDAKSGVSVMSVTNATTTVQGINIDPAYKDIFTSAFSNAYVRKSCAINAAPDFVNQSLDLDICLDITDQLKAALTGDSAKLIPTLPMVTTKLQGNIKNEVVTDCFASGASVVVDALSKKVWTKETDPTLFK